MVLKIRSTFTGWDARCERNDSQKQKKLLVADQDKRMNKRIEIIADVLLTALVFGGIYFAKQRLLTDLLGELTPTPNYSMLLLMIMFIWYVTLDLATQEFGYGTKLSASMVMETWKNVSISTVVLILCLYIFKISDISRQLIFLFYGMDLVVLNLSRWLFYRLISSKRKDEYFQRHILIIGSRIVAQELIQLLSEQNDMGIKIVGCLDTNREDIGKTVAGDVQIIGTMEDLKSLLLNQVIDEVFITMPLNIIANAEWYLSFINSFGITVRIIPYWYIRKFMTVHTSHSIKIENFLSEPAMVVSRIPSNQNALVIKSIIDYLLAVFVLIVTFPFFLMLPPLIKLLSPGPVFFKQIRSGQYGRKYYLVKFRSMVIDAEEMQYTLIEMNEAHGPAFKIKNDPRIIPFVGKFIRKFGIDEIPQFINVIRGEMSVVGPRPPTPSEVQKYELWHRRRLSMKPGITCTWQIQPKRNDILFDEWMNMDLEYIDNWSLWKDFVIILKTVPAILSGHGR